MNNGTGIATKLYRGKIQRVKILPSEESHLDFRESIRQLRYLP